MRPLRRLWRRLRASLLGSRQADTELDAEIESHLAMLTDLNIQRGMPADDARRTAVLAFGGLEGAREACRDQRGIPWLDAFRQDVRYACRLMRGAPGFTVVAVLSLGLGIGGATAIFSVARAVLLPRLPYAEPVRLVTVSIDGAISAPYYDRFRRQSRTLESTALFVNWPANLSGAGEPVQIPGARVSASLFDLLGTRPAMGRTFTAAEDRDGNDAVVLISHELWSGRFAADPGILGRKVVFDRVPYTVVGVMPEGFQFPHGPELPAWVGKFPPAQAWRPMALVEWERTSEGSFNFAMLGRLRHGASPGDARAELTRILDHGQQRSGESPIRVQTLHDSLTHDVRQPLVLLFSAVAVALLLACINVTNLLLARGLRRRPEIALRMSLGADRSRVVRQLLTEAGMLACLAAIVAVPVAWTAVRALRSLAPPDLPLGVGSQLDVAVLGWGLLLALLSAALVGMLPALDLSRRAPADTLKDAARGSTGSRATLRRALIVGEFALSLLLLTGAILLTRSFVTVSRTPYGFHVENILTLRLTLPRAEYDESRRAAAVEQLVAACQDLRGVTRAAAVSTLPLTGESEGWGIAVEGSPAPGDRISARTRAVTPGYFRTLGIRLKAGREFTAADRGQAPVAILSETAARRLWPGVADPVGRRLHANGDVTVVGIVEDTRASGLDADIRPYMYVPFTQFSPEEFALALRTDGHDPMAVVPAVRSEIRRLDPAVPITHLAVMQQLVADALAARRFQTALMGAFAAFAIVLAAIGIAGILSHFVAQRTHEIGVRMALGATPGRILRGVVTEAAALAAAGAVCGWMAARAATPVIASSLYGVEPTDGRTFAVAAALLIVTAVLASLLPATQAAGMAPMSCLRHE